MNILFILFLIRGRDLIGREQRVTYESYFPVFISSIGHKDSKGIRGTWLVSTDINIPAIPDEKKIRKGIIKIWRERNLERKVISGNEFLKRKKHYLWWWLCYSVYTGDKDRKNDPLYPEKMGRGDCTIQIGCLRKQPPT